MKQETHKRNKTILIKVSEEEKDKIEQKAAEYGGTVSEMIRNKILCTTKVTTGKQLQELACSLCQLATLTNQISDSQLRGNFEEVQKSLWQSIK